MEPITYIGRRFEIGTRFVYCQHLLSGTDKANAPVYVFLEAPPEKFVPFLETFVKDGIMPGGLTVFLGAGMFDPTLPGGAPRNMRAENFDQYQSEFSDLLAEELIPDAAKRAGVTISPNPDLHFIAGGSSGGMAAWNALWFRNDFFRRGVLMSPTFSAMRGGEEAMVIARKTETRPMRVYMSVGTTEPDYYFGDSYLVARNAESVMMYTKSDYHFDLFVGEGHCSRGCDPVQYRKIMEFLWKDWDTVPLVVKQNNKRIETLLDAQDVWEPAETMPAPQNSVPSPVGGVYTFDGGKILLRKDGKDSVVASDLNQITGIALSTDNWRLYVSDRTRRFLFAYAILPDGTLGAQYKLCPLHLAHDCRCIGATSICLAEDDRIFAATELGVQTAVSFGILDMILPLPGDKPAVQVAMEGFWLYAKSSDGRIYRRKLKRQARKDGELIAPFSAGYGDTGSYNREH